VQWQVDAGAGSGKSAQAIIDSDLDIDHLDIYIGLCWHRLGTPTGEYASGTIHEFEKAKAAARTQGRVFDALFFQKDAPIPQKLLDPGQFAELRKFVESLKPDHLIKSYGTLEHLADQISLALSKFKRRHSDDATLVAAKPLEVNPEASHSSEAGSAASEVGLLDCVDDATDAILRLTEGLGEGTELMREFGGRIEAKSLELRALGPPTSPSQAIRARQRLDEVSAIMQEFSCKLNGVLEKVRPAGHDLFRLWAQIYALAGQFDNSEDNREQLKAQILGLVETFPGTHVAFEKMHQQVSVLPPATTKLVAAKKSLLGSIASFRQWARELASLASELGIVPISGQE